ncbi:hypothetical protein [Kocuria palustris]|uniref:hypothetical protein n=1 Tax=Kocuria palustris TaxID=71999 RepID=UPI003D74D14E
MPSTGPEAASSGHEDDEGSAVVEFLLVGVVLLVPILIFVGVLAQAQAAAFAAVAAAQQGSQVLASQPAGGVSTGQVQSAAALPAADQGFDDGEIEVSVTCSDGTCEEAGATATVTAVATVRLPRIPFVGMAEIVQMEHSSTVVVGRYS